MQKFLDTYSDLPCWKHLLCPEDLFKEYKNILPYGQFQENLCLSVQEDGRLEAVVARSSVDVMEDILSSKFHTFNNSLFYKDWRTSVLNSGNLKRHEWIMRKFPFFCVFTSQIQNNPVPLKQKNYHYSLSVCFRQLLFLTKNNVFMYSHNCNITCDNLIQNSGNKNLDWLNFAWIVLAIYAHTYFYDEYSLRTDAKMSTYILQGLYEIKQQNTEKSLNLLNHLGKFLLDVDAICLENHNKTFADVFFGNTYVYNPFSHVIFNITFWIYMSFVNFYKSNSNSTREDGYRSCFKWIQHVLRIELTNVCVAVRKFCVQQNISNILDTCFDNIFDVLSKIVDNFVQMSPHLYSQDNGNAQKYNERQEALVHSFVTSVITCNMRLLACTDVVFCSQDNGNNFLNAITSTYESIVFLMKKINNVIQEYDTYLPSTSAVLQGISFFSIPSYIRTGKTKEKYMGVVEFVRNFLDTFIPPKDMVDVLMNMNTSWYLLGTSRKEKIDKLYFYYIQMCMSEHMDKVEYYKSKLPNYVEKSNNDNVASTDTQVDKTGTDKSILSSSGAGSRSLSSSQNDIVKRYVAHMNTSSLNKPKPTLDSNIKGQYVTFVDKGVQSKLNILRDPRRNYVCCTIKKFFISEEESKIVILVLSRLKRSQVWSETLLEEIKDQTDVMRFCADSANNCMIQRIEFKPVCSCCENEVWKVSVDPNNNAFVCYCIQCSRIFCKSCAEKDISFIHHVSLEYMYDMKSLYVCKYCVTKNNARKPSLAPSDIPPKGSSGRSKTGNQLQSTAATSPL